MRQLLVIASLAFLIGLSACTSAYSVFVDTRPEESPASVSHRLGARYPSIGFEPYNPANPALRSSAFPLGSWFSRGTAGIHHAEKEGILWIWITPPPGSDTASTIVDDVKKIISEVAPRASIRVVESRSPDLR